MRWHSAKVKRPSPAQALRLEGEKAQLEEILATTTNQSIAEMARIKLRVVNFVSTNASDSHKAERDAIELSSQPVQVELPRPVSCAPASHLIDLSRQRPSLERIRRALPEADRFQLSATGPAEVSSVRLFLASSAEHRREPRWFSWGVRVGSLCALLIGPLVVMLSIAAEPPNVTLFVVGLALIFSPFAVWTAAYARRIVEPGMQVYWEGVKVSRRLYRWRDIDSINLTLSPEGCECEVAVHRGPVIRRTLSYFTPSFPQWLSRLREVCSEPAILNVDDHTPPPQAP